MSRQRTNGSSSEVIVVAPAELLRSIVKSVNRTSRVLAFTTLQELDHWRRTEGFEDPSIYHDLITALIEVGCRLTALPRKLRTALEGISAETNVPPLRKLESLWPSRRSFYRTWDAHLEIAPAAFLRRVLALHANRLMASGRTKKEAALLAGYSSVDQMRRNVRQD